MQKMTPEELKNIRQSYGLRSSEMARAIEVSVTCYHRWENGKRPIPENIPLMLDYLHSIVNQLQNISRSNVDRLKAAIYISKVANDD